MAYTTIDNPELYFQTKLFTGTGSSNSVTLDGSENMRPDWVWIKNRDSGSLGSQLHDVIRGTTKRLFSNSTDAEETDANGLTAFNSNGFTLGSNVGVNQSSSNMVAWNWSAGGSASSNSDGSITSTVSANTTAGFSIVSFTGNATAGATIGHGLGVTPKWVIVKNRSNAQNWFIYHEGIGATKVIYLDLANASQTLTQGWNDTAPTSSVVSLGTEAGTNQSGANMIAYCFAEKKGYSKFSKYVGNGNADGTFVYTGFKPAFVLFKGNNTSDWQLFDNKRDSENPVEKAYHPDITNVASTDQELDFLSNGFKLRDTGAHFNGSGVEFYYIAFAESPFVNSNGVPNNAR